MIGKDYFAYVETDDAQIIENAIEKIKASNEKRPHRRGDVLCAMLKTVSSDKKLIDKCIELLK